MSRYLKTAPMLAMSWTQRDQGSSLRKTKYQGTSGRNHSRGSTSGQQRSLHNMRLSWPCLQQGVFSFWGGGSELRSQWGASSVSLKTLEPSPIMWYPADPNSQGKYSFPGITSPASTSASFSEATNCEVSKRRDKC